MLFLMKQKAAVHLQSFFWLSCDTLVPPRPWRTRERKNHRGGIH